MGVFNAAVPAPMEHQPLIYLVDDEPSVRRALTRLLRAAGFELVSFATAEDFLAAVHPEGRPSCLVVDLRMPGLNGLELQELMRQQGLQLPIIFISGHADVGSGIQAMKRGAVDFLEKPLSSKDLIACISRALDRGRRQRTEATVRTALEARALKLTPREREVFGLVVAGLANKQVGAELGASEKTIKVHRARVMEKMEAGSLAELVRMADKLRLGPNPPARSDG
jgi:FixJ family two-component response regulator